MTATELDSLHIDQFDDEETTPADPGASDLMAGIISVHHMVPKYLTGTPGLTGICAGCQWCGRFDSPDAARLAHAGHVLDVFRSNGCDVVGLESYRAPTLPGASA